MEIVFVALVVGVVVWIYRRGKRIQEQMNIDPETVPIGDALRARNQQRRAQGQVRAMGHAIGDRKLGGAMATALEEMTGSCPECHGLVWTEAEACGHCGHRLREGGSEAEEVRRRIREIEHRLDHELDTWEDEYVRLDAEREELEEWVRELEPAPAADPNAGVAEVEQIKRRIGELDAEREELDARLRELERRSDED